MNESTAWTILGIVYIICTIVNKKCDNICKISEFFFEIVIFAHRYNNIHNSKNIYKIK